MVFPLNRTPRPTKWMERFDLHAVRVSLHPAEAEVSRLASFPPLLLAWALRALLWQLQCLCVQTPFTLSQDLPVVMRNWPLHKPHFYVFITGTKESPLIWPQCLEPSSLLFGIHLPSLPCPVSGVLVLHLLLFPQPESLTIWLAGSNVLSLLKGRATQWPQPCPKNSFNSHVMLIIAWEFAYLYPYFIDFSWYFLLFWSVSFWFVLRRFPWTVQAGPEFTM